MAERILDGSMHQRQLALEEQAIQDGAHRYRTLAQEVIARGEGAALKPAERFLVHWFQPLVHAIRMEQRGCRAGKPGAGRQLGGPILCSVDARHLAVITMHEALGMCMAQPDGIELSKLASRIGTGAVAEIGLAKLKLKAVDQRKARRERNAGVKDPPPAWKDPTDLEELYAQFRTNPNAQQVHWWSNKRVFEERFKRSAITAAGVSLVWLLVSNASSRGYDEDFNLAFRHKKVRRHGSVQTVGVIRLDDEVVEKIEDGHVARQTLRPVNMPMVVPPLRWDRSVRGGFLRITTPMLTRQRPEQRDAIDRADMGPVYEGVNALNRQSWSVHKPMLDVIEFLWESGGGSLGIPRSEPIPMPVRTKTMDEDEEAHREWKSAAHAVYKANISEAGQRSEFSNRLAIAKKFVDEPEFYQTHQLDFRARAYASPYLNHMADDVSRSLMLFAEPRELTDIGYWHLAVHAANLWGVEQCSFEDRAAWTRQKVGAMVRAAVDPMVEDWWTGAEDPLQFLAVCHAFNDPEIGARFPVHRDGTMNGLQHYAALARDPEAAHAVNLRPTERPQDAYIAVVGHVAQMVQTDAAGGGVGARLAEIALPLLCRDLLKTPIMTTIYDVTRHGQSKQIDKKLVKIGGLERRDRMQVAAYLSKTVRLAVEEVCSSATEIMDWLKLNIGRIVDKHPRGTVKWTTPLGFPVIQPYRQGGVNVIRTVMQQVSVGWHDTTAKLAPGRQVRGISPNFIHSLDSSHMLMAAVAAQDEGIAFAAVHDSFWTHAQDVDALDALLRDQFIALHEQPLMTMLFDEWRKLYPDVNLLPPPVRGDWDVNEIASAPYAFS